MKLSKFSKSLKEWRGKRLQKEAAEILDVNVRTYEGWESGRNLSRYSMNHLRKTMAENPERLTK
jgi:DNA-binding transcriptional regulator YiaG